MGGLLFAVLLAPGVAWAQLAPEPCPPPVGDERREEAQARKRLKRQIATLRDEILMLTGRAEEAAREARLAEKAGVPVSPRLQEEIRKRRLEANAPPE